MESGIYVILNTMTEQVYVGQSKNLSKRLKEHWSYLTKESHHNPHLQSSFLKYGKDSFVFRVMEYCGAESLTDREQYWINQFNSHMREFGFNLRPASKHDPLSKETRAKISEAKKNPSKETRAKMSAARKGKPLSAETIERIKLSKRSEEDRARMSAAAKAGWEKRRMESL
jgi:group I intron endonuclease